MGFYWWGSGGIVRGRGTGKDHLKLEGVIKEQKLPHMTVFTFQQWKEDFPPLGGEGEGL